MRALMITLDMLFSLFIFIGLLYSLSITWNSMVEELGTQEDALLQLRTQQTLDHLVNYLGSGHRLNQAQVFAFINRTNHNYTGTKNSLGLEDADMKFIVTDFNDVALYQTNTTPSGSLVVTSARYEYMDQPVKLELWVWR